MGSCPSVCMFFDYDKLVEGFCTEKCGADFGLHFLQLHYSS